MTNDSVKKRTLIRAGVGAIVFKGDSVLLIERGKAPFKGQWSVPGGALEYGEPLEVAVKREVAEETGIDINLVGLLNVYESLPPEPDSPHHLMIDYIARWKAGKPVAGDDAAKAAFFSINKAMQMVGWDTTRTAIRDAWERLQSEN